MAFTKANEQPVIVSLDSRKEKKNSIHLQISLLKSM